MRKRLVIAAFLMLVIATVSACAPAAVKQTPVSKPAATPAKELPPLTDENLFMALLGLGLKYSYQLAPADGTIEVLDNTAGYGALRWRTDDKSVLVSRRDVDGAWKWTYVDERVNVDSVTPDALTSDERASFLALANDIVAAVGMNAPVSEDYTFKAAGGVSQGDYSVGLADAGTAKLHFATDAQGRIGRIDFDSMQ